MGAFDLCTPNTTNQFYNMPIWFVFGLQTTPLSGLQPLGVPMLWKITISARLYTDSCLTPSRNSFHHNITAEIVLDQKRHCAILFFIRSTNLFVVIYRFLGSGRLNYWIAFITMKPYTDYSSIRIIVE